MSPRIDYRNADGEKLTGTTTVVGQNLGWSKNVLVAWAKKITKQASLETLQDLNAPEDVLRKFMPMLNENLKSKEDNPLDIGTLVHAWVEADLKMKPDLYPKIPPELKEKVEHGAMAYLEWKDQVHFELMAAELSLVSEIWNYGGTMDIVARVKGLPSIIDIKTGEVYSEHRIQIRAYAELWNELLPDEKIQAYYLLRLGKEDGSFSFHYYPSLDDEWKIFQLLLQLEDYRKKLKA